MVQNISRQQLDVIYLPAVVSWRTIRTAATGQWGGSYTCAAVHSRKLKTHTTHIPHRKAQGYTVYLANSNTGCLGSKKLHQIWSTARCDSQVIS